MSNNYIVKPLLKISELIIILFLSLLKNSF